MEDPAYKAAHQQRLERLKALMEAREGADRSATCTATIPLPVAFHFQGISNPDIACLRDLAIGQLQILNDDYQGVNSDISLWDNGAAQFFPGIDNGESCIQFCLPTSGHPAGFGLNDGDPAVTINQTGNNSFNSNWSGYINIYVRNIGALGFSPLGGNGNGDGVTVDVAAFGAGAGCSGVSPSAPYDLGRTLTHELGHYLGLRHIWGGGCGDDDGIADTPNSSGSYGGCPANGASSCGSTDMHMNYMDYVNDACMYMYSAGQIAVMDAYASANLQNVINNAVGCDGPVATTAVVNFVTTEQTVDEGSSDCFAGGSKIITIPLEISSAPDEDVTVFFDVFGTATIDGDYRILNNTVTFPAGSTEEQSIEIELFEDVAEENIETIEVFFNLSVNSDNVVAGENTFSFITILDDDMAPVSGNTEIAIAQNLNEGFAAFNLAPFTTVHFYDQANGKLMLSVINPGSHDYGCTTVLIDRSDELNPGAFATTVGDVDFITDKTFFIDPENNNLFNSYRVRLYYTSTEIDGFLTESGREDFDLRMYRSDIDIQSELNNLELRMPTVDPFGDGFSYEAEFSAGMAGFALGVEALSLPVELTGFRAAAIEKRIDLAWATAAEYSNAGFEVLRRGPEEQVFQTIGWIEGSNEAQGASYEFSDVAAIPGLVYAYQLRQLDTDGTAMISDIVTASIAAEGLNVSTYPNPVADLLQVRITGAEESTLSLMGVDGKVFLKRSHSGSGLLNLDTSELPAGIYFLMTEGAGSVEVRKIIHR